jgi:uncharacterized protein YjbI with pentapeptide repeats
MSFRARARRSLSTNAYQSEHVKGDFRNALSENCAFKGMTFDECQMGLASFYKSIFIDCEFHGCNLSAVNFNGCSFKNVHFFRCNLDQAAFKSATFDGCSFIEGRAEYASFENAGVKDVRFDLQLHGADLRWHGAINVDYGNSNLWGASIKVGCKQFVGATLDHRQLELLLGLISKTRGNDLTRHELKRFISADIQKVVDKITLGEEGA